MKNNDKITLKFGQLKRLVKEAKELELTQEQWFNRAVNLIAKKIGWKKKTRTSYGQVGCGKSLYFENEDQLYSFLDEYEKYKKEPWYTKASKLYPDENSLWFSLSTWELINGPSLS